MTYNFYYLNTWNPNIPTGSRSVAQVYPGAVSPSEVRFGRSHGTAPATGEIVFKGSVSAPPAQDVQINIGSAVFYGIVTKVETGNDVSSGNQTTIRLVDYRDRLNDVNHFAQYNMMDERGYWWHILPDDWQLQRKIYVRTMQTIDDFSEKQELADVNLNLLTDSPPMFSAYTLLLFLAETYNFEVQASFDVEDKLQDYYPENLDWNNGKKVIECIQEILEKFNMQFTAWGNLVIYVTEKGVPDNDFEQSILAGTINLCAFGNYMRGSLGNELSDKPRRVKVIGGRNKYEQYYPCYPDWNPTFTFGLCDNGYEFSDLLQSTKLSWLNKLSDFPDKYQDTELHRTKKKQRKHGNRDRSLMSIKDYIDQICFKYYFIDFLTPLRLGGTFNLADVKEEIQDDDGNLLFTEAGNGNLNFVPVMLDSNGLPTSETDSEATTSVSGNDVFDYEGWYNGGPFGANPGGGTAYGPLDATAHHSQYPISRNLATDSSRQIYVNSVSRALHLKGFRTSDQFAQGEFTYITDGTNLEIEDYVLDNPGGVGNCREFYKVSVVFSERRFNGSFIESVNSDGSKKSLFNGSPAQVYCRIAFDADVYTYTLGDDELTPRLRESAIQQNDIFKSVIFGEEAPLLAQNFVSSDFINTVYADDIASQIAMRALNHEYITTAGNVEFRTQAGYMPSGVIESVSTSFSGQTGTREVINFTNIFNDERATSYFTPVARNKAFRLGEQELKRRALQEEAMAVLREGNKNVMGANRVDGKNDPTIGKIAQVFGGEDNSAMVMINPQVSGNVQAGELMIVSGSPATQALNT